MSILTQSTNINTYYVRIGAYSRRPEIKVISSLTLSIITVIFLTLFAIKPTIITISGLLREIEDKKDFNQTLDIKINQLTLAQSQLNIYQDQLPLLDQALPNESFSVNLIRQIEYLIANNGLTFQGAGYQGGAIDPDLKPAPKLKQKVAKEKKAKKAIKEHGLVGLNTYDINLRLAGKYDQIASLMADLNNLSRLLIIHQVIISHPVNNSASVQDELVVTLQLQAYYTDNQ